MRVWQDCDSTATPMVQCKKCVHLPENRWCKKVNAECRPDEWHRCRFFKQKTNADRIRAMSDEELGMFVLAAHLGYKCWCNFHCENEGDGGCDKCIAEWLKQPVEEG